MCQSALYTVKWFINIRDQIWLDRVGRSKPPVKSCYLKVKIRSVCIPWAHTSCEIAQSILKCMPSQLRLTILSTRPVNWMNIPVCRYFRVDYAIALKNIGASICQVLAACLKIYVLCLQRTIFVFFLIIIYGLGTLRVREAETCLRLWVV